MERSALLRRWPVLAPALEQTLTAHQLVAPDNLVVGTDVPAGDLRSMRVPQPDALRNVLSALAWRQFTRHA